jgi:hypothetical protein
MSTMNTPDPVFAAIAASKTTHAAFMARCYFEDDPENGIKQLATHTPEMVRLVDAAIAARVEVAETIPTTKAGLVSVLRFVREQSEHEFFFDGVEESTRFVTSLEQAVLRLMEARS